jgi:putative transposase
MPRLSRGIFGGIPHHITQRGNRRENVFFTEEDRTVYLDWMKEYGGKHRVEVLAYCLMTDPIHLVAVPENEEGLQRVLKPLHMQLCAKSESGTRLERPCVAGPIFFIAFG